MEKRQPTTLNLKDVMSKPVVTTSSNYVIHNENQTPDRVHKEGIKEEAAPISNQHDLHLSLDLRGQTNIGILNKATTSSKKKQVSFAVQDDHRSLPSSQLNIIVGDSSNGCGGSTELSCLITKDCVSVAEWFAGRTEDDDGDNNNSDPPFALSQRCEKV